MLVIDFQTAADGVFEFASIAVGVAPQLVLGRRRKPAVDQLEPRAPVDVNCRWERG